MRRAWIVAALALVLGGCATGGAEFEQGQTLAGQQKYDEAIRAYEQAIAKEPDNQPYKAELAKVRTAAADAQLRSATAAASAMSQLQDVDRGLAVVERALAYDRNHGPSLRFQQQLRERRQALGQEIDRLLAEARTATAAEDFARAEQAVARVLAIDPGNAAALRQRQEASQAARGKSLRLAEQAEGQEDWREAVRYLKEALGREPSNEAIQARLRTAEQRDSLAYFLTRSSELEQKGQLEPAYGYLKVATKYWGSDVRLRDAMDRMARDGRRRYYTDALQRAQSDDWGRAYASLAQPVQAFGPAPRVDPQLRTLVRDLSAKLYERALEFDSEKLWGNMYLWFRTLEDIDPLYRDTAAKVQETRDKLMDRATVKIAVSEFEAPKTAPDAGSIVSGSILTNLFKLRRPDFKVIEREALQPILKEISIGQTGVVDIEKAKQIGKIEGVDVILVGRVLQYKVDQNEAEGRKTVNVQVGNRTVANPAYDRHMIEVREGRKKSTDPAPAQTIAEPVMQLFTYRVGTVTAIGYVSVSFRLVEVERGQIRLADTVEEQEAFSQDYSEGVDAAGIAAVSKKAPIPTEVLNRVTDKAVAKVVQIVGRHFANRQEQFLLAGRELQRRRQFTRAIEEYMNTITSAELEKTGQRFSGDARGHVDELLRQ